VQVVGADHAAAPGPGQVAGGGRGVGDLTAGQAELVGQRGQVDRRVGGHLGQRRPPQGHALVGAGPGQLEPHERGVVQRVARLPGGLAGQEGGRRAGLDHRQHGVEVGLAVGGQEGVELVDVEQRPLQAGLAVGELGQRGALVGRAPGQPLPAHHQQLGAEGRPAGLGHRLLAGAVRALAVDDEVAVPGPDLVGQPGQPGTERRRQHQPVDRRGRRYQAGHGLQPLVEPVVVEQVAGHPGVEPQRPCQQRGRGVAGLVDRLHQPVVDQRCGGGEAVPGRHPGLELGAEQAQHEVDRGGPPGDVVVEVGVEPLVAPVELGGQADQHDVEVEGGQVEQVGQHQQPQVDAALHAGQRALGDLGPHLVHARLEGLAHLGRQRHPRPGRCPDGRGEQLVDLGVGHVVRRQPRLAVTVSVAVVPTGPVDLDGQQQVEPRQLGQDVLERARVCAHD
jgi:hypothetical protein